MFCCLFHIHEIYLLALFGPFTVQNDRFPYPFTYFNYPLIFEKGTLGGIPYNGLCWEVPPHRGIFFRLLQVYERVGISQVEVHEMVGKSIILVCKKAQNF